MIKSHHHVALVHIQEGIKNIKDSAVVRLKNKEYDSFFCAQFCPKNTKNLGLLKGRDVVLRQKKTLAKEFVEQIKENAVALKESFTQEEFLKQSDVLIKKTLSKNELTKKQADEFITAFLFLKARYEAQEILKKAKKIK